MLERKLKRGLTRVLRALEKIEEGTYGLCDVTGESISRSRLERVPEVLESAGGSALSRTREAISGGAESPGT